MEEPADVVSAGAVVSRKGEHGREVLLVHRPKYDDWSFPKGKLDPGEHVLAAAVREVAEETGLDVRLGPPLGSQSYQVGDGRPRRKRVYYWAGVLTGCDDVSGYRPNHEVDAVRWVPLDEAPARLTYDYDRDTLAAFRRVRKKAQPVVVLRHSSACPRESWEGDDRERPLSSQGEYEAEEVVPLLAAYGVGRIVSSSSRRCWTTVAPYADSAEVDLEVSDDLSEEDATEPKVRAVVRRVLAAEEPAVVCTHRPVLPWVLRALGVGDRELEPTALVVVHHRRGVPVAVEHHELEFG
jgi:8-oxo-dGTP diphosphatase